MLSRFELVSLLTEALAWMERANRDCCRIADPQDETCFGCEAAYDGEHEADCLIVAVREAIEEEKHG